MELTENYLGQIQEFFNFIQGKICWSVVAGSGTGSMVSLSFGRKIPRLRPIKNSTLSDVQRKFDGEFKLFIQDAHWQVEDRSGLLCCNEDDNKAGGSMVPGLQRLTERAVKSAGLVGVVGDFEVVFDGELRLRVFCVIPDAEMENYSLFSPELSITLGGNGQVKVTQNQK